MGDSLYGLVCTGGGVTGAYQVGVLKYIHEFFCREGRSPFKIFSGVSCGALSTSFYACESFQASESRLRLGQLWEKFHVPEYHQDILKSVRLSLVRLAKERATGRQPLWSLLDPKPMLDIIREGYSRENLERAFQSGSTLGVSVAVTEVISYFPCWFLDGPRAVEWKRFHSIGIKDSLSPLHVAASCSIPFFMPPVRIGDHYFVDGSVKLERPFSAAISMGATRILSISTLLSPAELPSYPSGFKPSYSTLIRFMLRAFTQDLSVSEAEQIRVLNRFSNILHHRGETLEKNERVQNALFDANFPPTAYQPIEILLVQPSRSSEELYREFQAEQRRLSRNRTPQTFMFHRDFIRKLIALGYEETQARHAELEQFFSSTAVSSSFALGENPP